MVKSCLPVVLALAPYFSTRAQPFQSYELTAAYPSLKLNRPVAFKESPDHRFYVLEQDGRILQLPAERTGLETEVVLDISDRKPHKDNEEGLLGLAFHPQFQKNRKIYLYYNQQNPKRSFISEFKFQGNRVDPQSERVLLTVPQPYGNHKGGDLHFGPDGFLYITLGDGGAANDPHGNGQNLAVLLGKILRIDVDGKSDNLEYRIPGNNPFVGKEQARPEIFAYGLRNVWRMSFDQKTGALWVGDVGQDKFEEVDVIIPGGNYGWNVREGFHPFKTPEGPEPKTIDPVIEYGHTLQWAAQSRFPDHSPGLSITGGYVYRGKKFPELEGAYIYADFSLGTVWALRQENGGVITGTLVKQNPVRNISAFGQDHEGEIFLLAFDGRIYELSHPRGSSDKSRPRPAF